MRSDISSKRYNELRALDKNNSTESLAERSRNEEYCRPQSSASSQKSTTTSPSENIAENVIENSTKASSIRDDSSVVSSATKSSVAKTVASCPSEIMIDFQCPPRHFIRNPITGEIRQVLRKSPHTVACEAAAQESKTPDTRCTASKSAYDKPSKNCSSLQLLAKPEPNPNSRRNPITGEGMGDFLHPRNIKNYFRSGMRINQPPGGISSGIF